MSRRMRSIDCVGFLVSTCLVLSSPSDSGWECFGWLTTLPKSFAFERLERTRLVKVNCSVKLIGKTRVEIVALPLSLRQIDHADGTFESRLTQRRSRWSIF